MTDTNQILSCDAFTIFGYSRDFNIDVDSLNNKFHALQQQYHPDKHKTSNIVNNEQAQKIASHINHAYTTLKNPLTRAKLLLKLSNSDLASDNALPQDFLLMQIDTHEQLVHARETNNLQLLNDLEVNITQKRDDIINKLTAAFVADNYSQAKNLTKQLEFYVNLLEHITDAIYAVEN